LGEFQHPQSNLWKLNPLHSNLGEIRNVYIKRNKLGIFSIGAYCIPRAQLYVT